MITSLVDNKEKCECGVCGYHLPCDDGMEWNGVFVRLGEIER